MAALNGTTVGLVGLGLTGRPMARTCIAPAPVEESST